MRWCALLYSGALAFAQPGADRCEGPPDFSSAAAQNDAEAQAALGYWFAEAGRTDCAIVALRRSVRLDPDSLSTRYNLGVALVDTGNYKDAIEELRAASEIDAGNARVMLTLGSVLLESGQPAEAEAALLSALDLGASAVPALAELARAQSQLGRKTDAVATQNGHTTDA